MGLGCALVFGGLAVAAPMQAAPVQAAPMQAAPVQAAPVQAAPVQAAPMQAAPVQAAPMQAAPLDSLSLERALAMALERDFTIARLESGVESAEGALLAAAGSFDTSFESGLDLSDSRTPSDEALISETEVALATAGWTRLLRGGSSLQGGVALRRADDRAAVSNRVTMSVTFRQPLLRGRGREVTTATERAAAKEFDAQRFDLQHTIAIRLRAVAVEYWLTTAALRVFEIFSESERRSQVLLETLGRLIEAGVLPRADRVQLEADLSSRTANRISAERSLRAAHRRLAVEIGLGFEEADRLPLPIDRFPAFDTDGKMPTASALASRARAGRPDVLAALSRQDAAEIRRRAAEDQLSSRLDLVITPSYQSVELGASAGDVLAPLDGGVDGFSGFVGFELERPVGNRRARGLLLQAEAALRQSEIEAQRIAERIGVLVVDSVEAVAHRSEQLENIGDAEELFATVVENEERMLRAGTSTLIDVISQTDRLTAAQQRKVNAELALALAVLELQFQSGNLVQASGDQVTVTADNLLTLEGLGDTP